MTTGVRKSVLTFSAIVILFAACHRREARSGNTPQQPATQTIAPAEARPAPTGTDAMTQTVEVEDSRSEEDGGTSSPGPATKAAPKPAPKPAPKKKH
jgi:hypothetical protein